MNDDCRIRALLAVIARAHETIAETNRMLAAEVTRLSAAAAATAREPADIKKNISQKN